MRQKGLAYPPPRPKKKAAHPYPSKKTTELYSKTLMAKQFQVLPNNANPNYLKLYRFIGGLFFPTKTDVKNLKGSLTQCDIEHLRLLLNNLSVVMDMLYPPVRIFIVDQMLIPFL